MFYQLKTSIRKVVSKNVYFSQTCTYFEYQSFKAFSFHFRPYKCIYVSFKMTRAKKPQGRIEPHRTLFSVPFFNYSIDKLLKLEFEFFTMILTQTLFTTVSSIEFVSKFCSVKLIFIVLFLLCRFVKCSTLRQSTKKSFLYIFPRFPTTKNLENIIGYF